MTIAELRAILAPLPGEWLIVHGDYDEAPVVCEVQPDGYVVEIGSLDVGGDGFRDWRGLPEVYLDHGEWRHRPHVPTRRPFAPTPPIARLVGERRLPPAPEEG